MTMPPWLYHLFGVSMLAIAAYSVLLLAMATASRRISGWDVELSHVAMGLSMAGMFVNSWAFGPSAMWEVLFGMLLAWFVVQSGRSLLTYGAHLPHTAVHALMSFSMLLMYWFPMGTSSSARPTSGPSPVSARVDPGLLLVVAVALLASAIFTLASDRKGAAIYGTHLAGAVQGGTSEVRSSGEDYLRGSASSAGGAEGVVASPRLLDGTHVVMCIAMAFMLILML